MSPETELPSARLGPFERYLTLWVSALCMITGILLAAWCARRVQRRRDRGAGQLAGGHPGLAHDRADAAEGRFRRDRDGGRHWRGITTTVAVNWLVKPFSMALLGWLFIGGLFRPLLPAGQIDSYIAGLICSRPRLAPRWSSSGRIWSTALSGFSGRGRCRR